MVGITLIQQLTNFIQTLKDEEILDPIFNHGWRLQNEEHSRFVLEVISMFSNDADVVISELTRCLNEPVVDFEKVIGYVHLIRGSSSSLCGNRMALACGELCQASYARDKGRCLSVFERMKNECNVLRENLDIIAQMERTILMRSRSRRS